MHLLDVMFAKLFMNYKPICTFILVIMLPKYFLAKIFVKVIRPSSYHSHISDIPTRLVVNVQ